MGGALARKGMKLSNDGVWKIYQAAADWLKKGDEAADDVARGVGSKLKVIDGKVGGKVPVEDYSAIRTSSVKNPNSNSLTLGKYAEDATSYTKRAGDTSYFDMGSDWDKVQKKYNLTDSEMFEYFNKPVLDEALSSGKTIQFTHSPLEHRTGALAQEWEYIKFKLNLTDANLFYEGGFWYVK